MVLQTRGRRTIAALEHADSDSRPGARVRAGRTGEFNIERGRERRVLWLVGLPSALGDRARGHLGAEAGGV